MAQLLYDADCSFCKRWVAFWKSLTGDRVEYIPVDQPDAAEFVDGEQRVKAAHAIFRVLTYASGYQWLLWAYRKVPGFAPVTEFLYRQVDIHRTAANRVTKLLWGDHVEIPSYTTACRIFQIVLGIVFFSAFVSLSVQITGLIGSQGILPVHFSDSNLRLLCIGGAVTSLAACFYRFAFLPACALYFVLIMSGQIFLSYQWDFLLLETGFLAVFLKPDRVRVWLFHWLLFRLMFESGSVKLLSGDPNWRALTAMNYHYWTQPLPTVFAWYMAQAPEWFQKFSTAFVFFAELPVPFLIFGPRRLRHVAAAVILSLQLLIFLTGNYAFFNVLAMALCLLLLDDSLLRKSLAAPARAPFRPVTAALFVVLTWTGAAQLGGMFGHPLPAFPWVERYGLENTYGLFAVMTTERHEIVIEGSDDGSHWSEYEFRYKPGDLKRAPVWVQPHQPRLDWQMWFAALGDAEQNPWFTHFLAQLLKGSPPVLALLQRNPFQQHPPKYIRALFYDYHFTDFAMRRTTGQWWRRELKGAYFPPASLK